MIWSVERILTQAYGLVPDLLHVDARVLNTFQAGTITQDPFQMLQNKLSFHNYVAVFQALLCYYIRVFEGHFGRDMFVVTDAQAESLTAALSVAEKLVMLRATDSDGNPSEISEVDTHFDIESEGQLDSLSSESDHHLFTFCTALVQHQIIKAYDSAIISFLAARSTITSHEDNTITFRAEGQIAGLLSKLIYCCQLILLQDAHYIKEFQQLNDVEVPLRELCQHWVVNNTRGPIGVMSDWRLYTMRVGGAAIPEALVVWDADGQNLTYGDTRYGITDLATEMSLALQEMKRIFHEELCLGLPDVPTFPLRELQDNWSNNRPGYSFIEDPRNLVYFDGCHDWLIRQISQKTDLLDLVFLQPSVKTEPSLGHTLPSSLSSSDDLADLLAAEAEEERRLLEAQEGAPALAQELEHDENTDWLRGGEWPRWFAQRPLALIVAASQQPSPHGDHDLMLGTWCGRDCISSAAEKRTLKRLIQATNLVFSRCAETLQDTPRILRYWLWSWSSTYLPYPFAMVQREATKRRYYSYFQRFLCYVYRIWLLATHVHAETVDVTGLQLTASQKVMMRQVWNEFASLPRGLEIQCNSEPIEISLEDNAPLIKNLFQLIIMFWTDLSTDRTISHNAVVHYSDVLGILPNVILRALSLPFLFRQS
ncbi:hypothetical protein PV08_12093 [Exophiala spinifera]|uniref:Uncharacterized protein n=1 Tax=Exophiala spinifera TaxID=91928 RepID=A0A0D2AT24_9EURO|nr:uncharacterized protein PV08_12093 [Exophiala spinifera]KIW09655.1 hypothetical protein PV08_12093 [Exophiala spinifera]